MIKKYFTDPGFLLLLAANFYCIWYFQNNKDGFATVIWIYWFQSVIIGLFNFIDLLSIKKFDAGNLKINNEPVTSANKGCVAWFFLVHYGFFHLGYAIFLLIQFGITTINGTFLLIGVSAFMFEAIVAFIRRKQQEKSGTINFSLLFFLPYLRIVPMHLTILLPAFLKITPSILFLVLKMVADILAYFLYQRIFQKNKTAADS